MLLHRALAHAAFAGDGVNRRVAFALGIGVVAKREQYQFSA
jgi:hypothetical protein